MTKHPLSPVHAGDNGRSVPAGETGCGWAQGQEARVLPAQYGRNQQRIGGRIVLEPGAYRWLGFSFSPLAEIRLFAPCSFVEPPEDGGSGRQPELLILGSLSESL